MPVILYQFENPPDFLTVRGKWCYYQDNKCCGWADNVPQETNVTLLSREQYYQRMLDMHKDQPFLKGSGESSEEERIALTDEEVLQTAEIWYNMVSGHS